MHLVLLTKLVRSISSVAVKTLRDLNQLDSSFAFSHARPIVTDSVRLTDYLISTRTV